MKRWIAAGFLFAVALNLGAQAPEMFRYQGRLASGTNLVNATLPMSFKLYDALSDGVLLYEDSSSVSVVDGLYSTTIGDNTVFGSLTNAMTNAAVYLELTVNGETLSPRERLVSVPYALNAPAPAPIAGDPAAVSNEVINARWTKNYYANGDITMSDRDTGLMWLYDASFAGQTNWYAAATYCDNLSYAGYSDWQLPRMGELGIQLYSIESFTGVRKDSMYWSGTSSELADQAWAMAMDYVNNNNYNDGNKLYNNCYVWPVRGGQAHSYERVIGLAEGNYFYKPFIDLDFKYAGTETTRELKIFNGGYKPLTVTSISYSDAHFSGDNWSGALQPGGSTNLTVTFAPTTMQEYNGTITVHGDQTSGNNTIVCKGAAVAMPYIDHGDGTVTDTLTGLMWTKSSNHGVMEWADAVAYCNNLEFAGYSDWRLPTLAGKGGVAELDTLFRLHGNPSGAWIGFEGTPFIMSEEDEEEDDECGDYWSASSRSTGTAWYLHIYSEDSILDWIYKDYEARVWPVRGGQ